MKLFSEKLNFAVSITFNKKKAPPTKEGFGVVIKNICG